MKQGLAVLGAVVLIVAVIVGVIIVTEHKKMDTASTPSGPTTNDTTHTTADGLVITDTKVGSGTEVQPGDTVTVKYTGKLDNGTVFDSTDNHGGQPITFPLANVIQGWQEGIPGMKVGGTRVLVIPAALAYGNQSVGGIPPNSRLTFTIELEATKATN